MQRIKTKVKRTKRRGAVAVEMAIGLPIILTVFWGFWEWSRVEMIRQAAATAAYEGARRGILPGATETSMSDVATTRLAPYSINTTTIDTVLNTDESTVTVTVPLATNLWGSGSFFGNTTINSTFTLRRE